jgi:phenylacetate-CoA ligase
MNICSKIMGRLPEFISRCAFNHRCIYAIALCARTTIHKTKRYAYSKSKDSRLLTKLLQISKYSNSEEYISNELRNQLSKVLKEALLNVPYYRETVKLKPHDFRPDEAYEALRSFPYLAKNVVMDNRDAFLNTRFKKQKMNYGTSGGSTGQGIGIWRLRHESEIERRFFTYHWAPLGYNDMSRIVRFGTEARKQEHELPWEVKGNRLLISPYHLYDRWLPEIFDTIIRFQPHALHGYPSCLAALGRFILETKKNPVNCKGILVASELFSSEQYFVIEKAYSGAISANYGLSEGTNLAFSNGPPEDDGFMVYRIDSLYGVTESRIDDDGFEEIIGTSYWNIAMPLIRYRTQDYGQIKQGSIYHLNGRSQEMLIAKSGQKIPGFSVKIDAFVWDYVTICQIVQREPGLISLRLVPRKNFTVDTQRQILALQLERWGAFFDIKIELVPHIPRTRSGKMRLVVSKL